MIRNFRQWLKKPWSRATIRYLRQWTRPAVLATLLVAGMTYLIETKIAKLETQRAAVSRSVAIYQDFVSSEAAVELHKVRHQIELLLWKDGGSPYKQKRDEGENRVVAVFHKLKTDNYDDLIRKSIVAIFQKIYLIYNCGNYKEKFKKMNQDQKISERLLNLFYRLLYRFRGSRDHLCDQKTISTLLGGVLLNLFYAYRPVIYCDRYFLDHFFAEKKEKKKPIVYMPGPYVIQFENLVINNLRLDMHESGKDKEFGIFITEAERQKAIEDGKFKKKAKNFTVLRSTQKRCHLYPKTDPKR